MAEFNAKIIKEQVVLWIRNFFEECGYGCNAVIGISGGKDSSITAALLVEALGKDRVIGVLMPNGHQSDISYARMLVEHLGIQSYTVNIADAVNGILDHMPSNMCITEQTKTNLPARIRMATLYAVSQSHNGRVANTCNLSEDWVGYSTRYGDAAGDFSPLANLTVTEVKAIGYELALPEELIEKKPSDGLCGKSDEDNLGFTYAQLDQYLRTGICERDDVKMLIDEKHIRNRFKMEKMPSFPYKTEIWNNLPCDDK